MDSVHDPSWWTQAHRQDFTRRALCELDRMRNSKFGAPEAALACGPMTEAAHSRMVRAARAKLTQGFRLMVGS